ncbi:MAG: flagellin FliC [Candidatus Hydrogenedentes bacterium]|nr:flagellin FliC [Candidatus Hydrogenedentota bacterium]
MALSIGQNPSAFGAVRNVQQTTKSLLQNYQRLASGQRINRAADDAAGLAIAETLRSDVRQYTKEVENLQSGISASQTADGALETQSDAVQRIRELAVQASNGTLTNEQRSALNEEAQQLLQQIDATASDTEYNGQKLLDGSQSSVSLGTEGGDQLSLNESTASALGINGVDLSTQAGAQSALSDLDDALESIGANRSSIGAQQSGFESAINVRETTNNNIIEAESRIRDADIARITIEQTRNQILLGAGVNAIKKSGINNQIAAGLLSK